MSPVTFSRGKNNRGDLLGAASFRFTTNVAQGDVEALIGNYWPSLKKIKNVTTMGICFCLGTWEFSCWSSASSASSSASSFVPGCAVKDRPTPPCRPTVNFTGRTIGKELAANHSDSSRVLIGFFFSIFLLIDGDGVQLAPQKAQDYLPARISRPRSRDSRQDAD